MNGFSLANEFSPASEQDWRAAVEKALGGAPFDVLQTPLREGFTTGPLYTQRSAAGALCGNRGWAAIQPVFDRAPLDGELAGVGALRLDLDASPGVETNNDVQALLGGGGRTTFLTAGASVADAALLVAAEGKPQGSAGFDPLTVAALSGELPADRSSLLADYADAAFYIREHCPGLVPFLASGHAWNAAGGGSATEELAFTLSAAVSYLRALTEAGMPVGEAARCIGFSLTAQADIFITIAAFRAMRLLWARALEAAGEAPNPDLLLVAQMPARIVSAYDPHVNLLRGTAAAFGAAIGGATGIEVLPFDSACGSATEFAQRLARNTSLVLQHEAYLPAVADPAAGSSYVEALTHQLASRAWDLFRQVEAQGGLAAALESGFVAEKLAKPAESLQRSIAHRQEKITGVSVFPNLSDAPPAPEMALARPELFQTPVSELVLPASHHGEHFAALVAAAASGASLSELRMASRTVNDLAFPPLDASARDAEPFEALRRQADIALASIGSRPPIFLALLGKPAAYRARANWVQSFFAAGGIEMVVPEAGFETVEALVEAFRESPAPAACLCSSNAGYASLPGAASALKNAGAVEVYLAGPAPALKALNAKDRSAIGRLIYEGCDAVAVLQEAQRVLRVEELTEVAGLEAGEEGFEVYAEVEEKSY